MRKISAASFGVLLCAFVSISMIAPVQAATWPASLPSLTWLPPYIQKAGGVVVYRHDSTVNLIVPVENSWYANGLNVSKVIIGFDWGQNKTLDLSAGIVQVGWYETELFTVSFTASATEAVSSEWAHEYTIYVEHVNATTGPTMTVDPTFEAEWYEFAGSDFRFAVYSTDQADALDLSMECASYTGTYDPDDFSNVNASQMAFQAEVEVSLGNMYYYTRRDYGSAETHYQTALDLYSQALAAEAEWRTTREEAELDIMLTEADANMAMANAMLRQADAAVNQSYAFILFGLGFVFMGIATIVYAYRKPMTG